MKTTDLLKMNLTDFLNEIEQDLKNCKYNLKLADLQVISNIDIQNFLQRMSNNFEYEKLMIIYDDIDRWKFGISNDEDNLPYITKQIKEVILSKIYDNVYSKTSEFLKINENYIDIDFEGEGIERLYFYKKLPMPMAKAYEGYSDAVGDYKMELENLQNKKLLTKANIENNKTSQPSTHFTRSFTADEQKNLFGGLIAYGFLPKEMIYSHFCHVFGDTHVPDGETPFEPLKWEKNVQLLRELVTSDKIKNKEINISGIEKKTPEFFKDKKGNPMKLAKNKHVPSTDSDNLQKILATL